MYHLKLQPSFTELKEMFIRMKADLINQNYFQNHKIYKTGKHLLNTYGLFLVYITFMNYDVVIEYRTIIFYISSLFALAVFLGLFLNLALFSRMGTFEILENSFLIQKFDSKKELDFSSIQKVNFSKHGKFHTIKIDSAEYILDLYPIQAKELRTILESLDIELKDKSVSLWDKILKKLGLAIDEQ